MQSVFQSSPLRLPFDKFCNGVQLAFTTRLKSAGVVKNIAVMV